MRVLQVVPYFYSAWAYGGIPRLSYHLCQALVKQGVEVEVITTDAFDEHSRLGRDFYQVDGISVRVYQNLSNYLAYHWQVFLPWGLKKEKDKIGRHQVIHIHGHRNFLNTYLSFWAEEKGIPLVLQPNGTLVNIERRRFFKAVYDLIWGNRQLKKTSLFIAVSKAEKEQFLSAGIPEEKIRIIPNGVFVEPVSPEVNFREKFKINQEYVLYLGKLTPRKGVEYLVQAISISQRKDLIAVIAGNDMGIKSRLEKLAERLGVSERVVFTGLLTSPWKESAYQDALLTVYAGQYEIFGLVPFESILCGTPAIVADDSGCGEWLKKSGGGWTVPYGDARALAQIIDNFSEEEKAEKVRNAQRWIKENLNWDKIAQQVKEVYQELV